MKENLLRLLSVPVYFVQGLSVGRWNHETGPWEGFGLSGARLQHPVLVIGVVLEVEHLAAGHRVLRQVAKQKRSELPASFLCFIIVTT